MRRWLLSLCVCLFLPACTVLQQESANSVRLADGSWFVVDPFGNTALQQALLAQYRDWRGTPYQLGGNSRQGIDCSAFVQKTLAQQFNVNVPRTTSEQLNVGREVSRSELQIGDMLFFRTGYTMKHVGLYLGRGVFLHASTKVGVTLNRLDEAYWRKTFWTVRRVM